MAAQIGIREAKINLSKYLKLVKAGQEVILTDRGCPVGKIVPIEKTELPLNVRVRHLEEAGLLEPENKTSKMSPPIPIGGKGAQQYLQEDRGL